MLGEGVRELRLSEDRTLTRVQEWVGEYLRPCRYHRDRTDTDCGCSGQHAGRRVAGRSLAGLSFSGLFLSQDKRCPRRADVSPAGCGVDWAGVIQRLQELGLYGAAVLGVVL